MLIIFPFLQHMYIPTSSNIKGKNSIFNRLQTKNVFFLVKTVSQPFADLASVSKQCFYLNLSYNLLS